MSAVWPLWEGEYPGAQTRQPALTYYGAGLPSSDATLIILPGGGYRTLCPHEGVVYARLLNSLGLSVFVLDYRTAPAVFPDELLDARRAVRFVRTHARDFGINPQKIAVMGSSAGGHLAALLSTYRGAIAGEDRDEIDKADYLPNLQILCYPVIIAADDALTHRGSFENLLGKEGFPDRAAYSPDLLADEKTPPAFLFHTAEDAVVDVRNSYRYAERLRVVNVPCEMHIFPFGAHGRSIATSSPHIAQWCGLLRNYLALYGYLPR